MNKYEQPLDADAGELEAYARFAVLGQDRRAWNTADLHGEGAHCQVRVWVTKPTESLRWDVQEIVDDIQVHGVGVKGEALLLAGWPDRVRRSTTLYLRHGETARLEDPIAPLERSIVPFRSKRERRVEVFLAASRALLGVPSSKIMTVSLNNWRGGAELLVRTPSPSDPAVRANSEEIEAAVRAGLPRLDLKLAISEPHRRLRPIWDLRVF